MLVAAQWISGYHSGSVCHDLPWSTIVCLRCCWLGYIPLHPPCIPMECCTTNLRKKITFIKN